MLLRLLVLVGSVAALPGLNQAFELLQVQADPQPCGSGNNTFLCSAHGTCTTNALNEAFCLCDHGYRGLTCTEKFFLEKTMEVTASTPEVNAMRYAIGGEVEGMLEVTLDGVTLAACLRACEDHIEFVCMAAVFVTPPDGATHCHLMDQRHIQQNTTISQSYTRGPETCFFGDGESYRGTANTSALGHACQRWDASTPHSPWFNQENSPRAGLTENYCRNPDGESGPWCYTIDGERWELCAIPSCTPFPTPLPIPVPTPTCPPNCQLHGTCDVDGLGHPTGHCSCFPGHIPGAAGDCAEEATCANECSGHGQCELGQCVCDQMWQGGGGDCSAESVPCPDDCSGHGHCDIETGRCACVGGFAGESCDQEMFLCLHNCSGNGVCDQSLSKCICAQGFSGEDCAESTCPNACSNHGTCDEAARTCNCHKGYVGTSCDQEATLPCPDDCNGHGNCVNGKCFCARGWTGVDCDDWVPLPCPNDCSEHGTCEDGVCKCDKHYSGPECSIYTQPRYTPWPVGAVVIPIALVVAFFGWVFHQWHKVDMADGQSELLEIPVIKWLFGASEKQYEIEKGPLSKSRFKRIVVS
eukprot:c4525_g1_i1.p1 GENE.c4525_g1_i1~~c4525_g1_i1.p1  ORF type:complete len:583 (+),score=86.28 c4525_g1_i1:46-1794(+)